MSTRPVNTRRGAKFIAKLPRAAQKQPISMCAFNGVLYIANGNRVWQLRGRKFIPLSFAAK